MACYLQIKGLDFSFRWKNHEREIFHDLNLCVQQGSFISVIGSNGSGKSSLLKLILGLNTPNRGDIHFEDKPIRPGYPEAVRQQRMVYLAQQIEELFYGDTVLQELSFTQGNMLEEQKKNIADLDLEHVLHQPVDSLSGGERQGVALAQFMASKAPLLLLDEPSSYLDQARAMVLKAFLIQAHQEGRTIIHTTQYANELGWGTHFIDLDQTSPEIVAL